MSSSPAISVAIWSVLKRSAVMDAGQAVNHSHAAEWRKSDVQTCVQQSVQGYTTAPRVRNGCVWGLFNHAVLGEAHGSVTGNDLRGAEPAECAELCAHCEAGDKHPGNGLLTGNSSKWRKVGQRGLALLLCGHCAFRGCHFIWTLPAPSLTFWALSHWSATVFTSTPSVTAPLVFHVTWG